MQKLLIVEDDMLLDEAYRKKFSEKYDVRVVTDGEGGINVCKTWKPDVVILDIYLPGKFDGIDVLREIKKDPETSKIPVLVLTNLPDTKEKVESMGAARCFIKADMDLLHLMEVVDELSGTKG